MGQRSIRSSQLPDLWPLSWKNPFWLSRSSTLFCSGTHRPTQTRHTQGMHARVKKREKIQSYRFKHDPLLLVLVDGCVGNDFSKSLSTVASYFTLYWPSSWEIKVLGDRRDKRQISLLHRCLCVCVLCVLKASSPPPPPPPENGSVFTLALDLDSMAQPLTPY